MAYFQGFLIPVPEGNRAAYAQMAEDVVPLFTRDRGEEIRLDRGALAAFWDSEELSANPETVLGLSPEERV